MESQQPLEVGTIIIHHLNIPISDEELEKDLYNPPYYLPEANHPALQYMHARRKELGGYIPGRANAQPEITLPESIPKVRASSGVMGTIR